MSEFQGAGTRDSTPNCRYRHKQWKTLVITQAELWLGRLPIRIFVPHARFPVYLDSTSIGGRDLQHLQAGYVLTVFRTNYCN